jgi:hypothetical protein
LSDLTTAQAAYDWYLAGKNPIIVYNNMMYILRAADNYRISFRSTRLTKSDITSWYSVLWLYSIGFEISWSTVTSVSDGISSEQVKVLTTDSTYQNAYIPTDDWNPATKKYVDDKVKNAIVSWTTAPSNPVVWQLWYDTTNNVLKVRNWTAWITIQELLVNWVNIKTVNNHNLLWSWNIDIIWVEEIQFVTQAEYDALPSTKTSDWKAYFIYSWHWAAIVSDEAFSSSWDWITTQAPSKNAIYDVLGDVETLLANL